MVLPTMWPIPPCCPRLMRRGGLLRIQHAGWGIRSGLHPAGSDVLAPLPPSNGMRPPRRPPASLCNSRRTQVGGREWPAARRPMQPSKPLAGAVSSTDWEEGFVRMAWLARGGAQSRSSSHAHEELLFRTPCASVYRLFEVRCVRARGPALASLSHATRGAKEPIPGLQVSVLDILSVSSLGGMWVAVAWWGGAGEHARQCQDLTGNPWPAECLEGLRLRHARYVAAVVSQHAHGLAQSEHALRGQALQREQAPPRLPFAMATARTAASRAVAGTGGAMARVSDVVRHRAPPSHCSSHSAPPAM